MIRKFTIFCMFVLSVQITLGGWTSANYAAVICPDFPTCQGKLWPEMDWRGAFSLNRLGVLENTQLVTIQVTHRLGAIVTAICLTILAVTLRNKILLVLLAIQISLGIINVIGGLPLWVSLAHNAVAALLLLTMISIIFRLYANSNNTPRLPNSL